MAIPRVIKHYKSFVHTISDFISHSQLISHSLNPSPYPAKIVDDGETPPHSLNYSPSYISLWSFWDKTIHHPMASETSQSFAPFGSNKNDNGRYHSILKENGVCVPKCEMCMKKRREHNHLSTPIDSTFWATLSIKIF